MLITHRYFILFPVRLTLLMIAFNTLILLFLVFDISLPRGRCVPACPCARACLYRSGFSHVVGVGAMPGVAPCQLGVLTRAADMIRADRVRQQEWDQRMWCGRVFKMCRVWPVRTSTTTAHGRARAWGIGL